MREVKTQAELDAAIKAGESDIRCVGGSAFTLYGNSTATLYGNSTATLYDNSRATLYGNSTATLCGNSTATLCDNSRATLYDNSRAKLYGNSRATLYDNSGATLYGNSRATLYGNSGATLYDNSGATLYDNSRAKLCGNSRATLYDNSGATATPYTAVHILSHNAKCKGGIQIRPKPATTVKQWCALNLASVKGAYVTLYKATLKDGKSPHGTAYPVGKTVTAPDWDGGKQECGYGLHACANPALSAQYTPDESRATARYFAIRVKLTDMRRPKADDEHPNKTKFRACKVLYECDIDGKKLTGKKADNE